MFVVKACIMAAIKLAMFAILSQILCKIKDVMESPFKGKTGITRLINAFGYSMEGLKAAYKNEDAFRQEVRMALVMIPLAFYFGHTPVERAIMIASVLLVVIVELLNSSVEATVDRISLDHHLLAKRAKDIGSAAVLISLVNMAVVWLFIICS